MRFAHRGEIIPALTPTQSQQIIQSHFTPNLLTTDPFNYSEYFIYNNILDVADQRKCIVYLINRIIAKTCQLFLEDHSLQKQSWQNNCIGLLFISCLHANCEPLRPLKPINLNHSYSPSARIKEVLHLLLVSAGSGGQALSFLWPP